jgi:hypothetical protein
MSAAPRSDDDKIRAGRMLCTGRFGGFAAKLAEAWFAADSFNRSLIENAWSDLFRRAHEAVQADLRALQR